MLQKYDEFAEVYERYDYLNLEEQEIVIKFIKLFDKYNIKYIFQSAGLAVNCPFHDDHKESSYVSLSGLVWTCFKRKSKKKENDQDCQYLLVHLDVYELEVELEKKHGKR